MSAKWLKVEDAAAQAQYSPRQFRRVMDEDHIPLQRFGRHIRVLQSDMDEWLRTKGAARHKTKGVPC